MAAPQQTLSSLLLVLVLVALQQCCGSPSAEVEPPPTLVKTNCFPELKQTEDPGKGACEERKCEYAIDRGPDEPFCLWKRSGYSVTEITDDKVKLVSTASLIRDADYAGPFPKSKDLDRLSLTVKAISDKGLRITISDPESKRYQVPKAALDIPEPGPSSPTGPAYRWDVNASSSFVSVHRKPAGAAASSASDNQTSVAALSLLKAGFVFSEQFIQLAIGLDCQSVVGFGEHNHGRLVHDRRYKRWTIFTRDASPTEPSNLYGAHPYFVCHDSGKFTGVLLKNSNAMEVELTPDGIIYRVLGGILDYYIFVADTPEELARTYSTAIGHPLMPPYWSLGFQLCRWGYKNVSEVRSVIARNRAIGLPYDVQYGDIDYMQNTMDFTIDQVNYKGLSEMVDELHSYDMRYFVILDPAISSDEELHKKVLPGGTYGPYQDGLKSKVFVTNPNGSIHEGEVWPGKTVFPDFTLPDTQIWWQRWVEDFYYNQSIRVDGLWIDMNEPASFTYEPHKPALCPNNTLNYPPYIPTSFLGNRFYEKTMCMETKQNWGVHYDVHSLYGHSMGMQSYETLYKMFPSTRPIVFSRSTYVGSGRYSQHWLGDNHSRWPDLHWSIVTMLEFGLFGFPYTGADICGFVFDADREMCIRWTQLGAFYPFCRNHNIKEADGKRTRDQDPASWDRAAQDMMKDALFFRYRYLPYLYTLFHYAHTDGSTVVRSLNHEFPNDAKTVGIDRQFLWGGAMLVSPVLAKGATNVEAYLPADGWYDAFSGTEVTQTGAVTLSAPLEHINVHIRKGFILPWQEPGVTTVSSRKNAMGLLVAAKQHEGGSLSATGSLFWDDGVGFETYKGEKYILHNFELSFDQDKKHHKLDIKAAVNNYTDPNAVQFKNVTVLGYQLMSGGGRQLQVSVNAKPHDKWHLDATRKVLVVTELALALGQDHQIIFAQSSAATAGVAASIGVICVALLASLTSWRM